MKASNDTDVPPYKARVNRKEDINTDDLCSAAIFRGLRARSLFCYNIGMTIKLTVLYHNSAGLCVASNSCLCSPNGCDVRVSQRDCCRSTRR